MAVKKLSSTVTLKDVMEETIQLRETVRKMAEENKIMSKTLMVSLNRYTLFKPKYSIQSCY